MSEDQLTRDHRARHVMLHKSLDELLADYLTQHHEARPSQMTVMELVQWSAQQRHYPTEPAEENKT